MILDGLVRKFGKDEKLVQPISFAATIFAVYGSWKVLYFFLSSPNSALHPSWLTITEKFAYVHLMVSGKICQLLGFTVTYTLPDVFHLNGNRGILVAEHCLAMPALFIFTFSVVFFPGSWRNKWWFLISGILGIFTINVVRLVLIAITFLYAPGNTFVFFHSFFYVLITYSLIFLMFAWWMNKFMLPKSA